VFVGGSTEINFHDIVDMSTFSWEITRFCIYNHKDLAETIHPFHVGHCLGNALVVTKVDNYVIHLAVLSTEKYEIKENWDMLKASFAKTAIEILKDGLASQHCMSRV